MPDYHDEIEQSFRWAHRNYHAPQPDRLPRYEALRDGARALAHGIDAACPLSREKLIALDRLAECIMWANRAISVNEAE